MNACAVSWAVVRLALGSLESGNNDFAVGKNHEISRYQIKRDVWEEYTSLAASKAKKSAIAWTVARRILEYRIYRNGFLPEHPPSYAQIYALWNAPGKMCRVGYRVDRLPKRIRERCERFQNLCERYAREGK